MTEGYTAPMFRATISSSILALLLFSIVGCTSGGGSQSQSDTTSEQPAFSSTDDESQREQIDPTTVASPNILLLIADDLGVESSVCYSENAPSAPRMAEFCQQGIVFENAWSNPICSPTRAGILTGRHSFRTGIGEQSTRDNGLQIDAGEWTLPRALDASESGYTHANFGKWHLGGDNDTPNDMGWSHFSGVPTGGLRDYERWEKVVDGQPQQVENYATTEIVDDTINWIDQQNQPWLAWVAFNAPHTPFHLPPNELHSAELSGTTADIEANPDAYYAAAIEALDSEVGRLLDSIEPDERERTTVIFIGDNGNPAQVSNSERGQAKGSLYEGGVHVPMVIWGAGVDKGSRTTELAGTVDLFSTILELAGVDVATSGPPDRTIDSNSLLPVIDGGSSASSYLYTELFGTESRPRSVGRTVRNDRYKLIEFSNGRVEFFDLKVDPEGADPVANLSPQERTNFDQLSILLDDLEAESADT